MNIIGTGSCLPEYVLSNAQIAETVPTSAQWVREHLGIDERRIVIGETTADLAAAAARLALADAGLAPEAVDVLIVATTTPARVAPATASAVARQIGAWRAINFDLGAVCAGFVYALGVAAALLTHGKGRYALVIGADAFSLITNWRARDCVYFGDGAGALLLARDAGRHALLDVHLYADARDGDAFRCPVGGRYTMDAPAVYDKATAVLPQAITAALGRFGLGVADLDWLLPHQASLRVLKKVADELQLPFERVLTNMARYGNTAAAAIPLLLDENARAGRFKGGERLLLATVGAGWAWGTALVEW